MNEAIDYIELAIKYLNTTPHLGNAKFHLECALDDIKGIKSTPVDKQETYNDKWNRMIIENAKKQFAKNLAMRNSAASS